VRAKGEMRASMYRLVLQGRPYGEHTVFSRLRDRYRYADVINEYEDVLDRVLLFLIDHYDCRPSGMGVGYY
jgi:hypothetical protein